MRKRHLFDRKPYLRAIVEPGLTILGIVAFCWWFDATMKQDAANLCSSDATAYAECSE